MNEDAGARGSPRSFKNIITQLFRQKQTPSLLAQQAAAADTAGSALCLESSVSSQREQWSRQCTAGRRCDDSDAIQPADDSIPVCASWSGPSAQGVPRQQGIASTSCAALPATGTPSTLSGTDSMACSTPVEMVASVASISSSLARMACTSSDLPASPCPRAKRGLARGPNGQVLASVDEVYAQLMDNGSRCPSPAASIPAAAAAAMSAPYGASLLSRTSTAASTVSTVSLGQQLSIPLPDAVPTPQYAHTWDDLTMPRLARIRTQRPSAGSDQSGSNLNADDSANGSSISDWQPQAAGAAGTLSAPSAAAAAAAAPVPSVPGFAQCFNPTSSSSSGPTPGGTVPSPVLARHKSMPRLRGLVPSGNSLFSTPPARSSYSLTSSGSGVGLAGFTVPSTGNSYSSTAGSGWVPGAPAAASGGGGAAAGGAGQPLRAAHRALFPAAAGLAAASFSRLQPAASAPSSPAAAAAGGGGGLGDAMAITAAAGDLVRTQEDIREINQDNILSIQFGPTGAKLLSFKYCAATSPLSQPGRSPFASPRAPREPSEFAAGSPAPGRFSSTAHLHPHPPQGLGPSSSSTPLSRAVSCNSPGRGLVVGTPPRGALRFPGGARSAMSSPAPGTAAAAAALVAPQPPPPPPSAGGVGAGALGVAAFFSPTELTQAAARLGSTSGRLDSVSSLGDLPENRVFQGQLAPVVRRRRRSSSQEDAAGAAAPQPPPAAAAAAAAAATSASTAVVGDTTGAWLNGGQPYSSAADVASTTSSRCASLEPSSMWGSIAAASRRESLLEPSMVMAAARSSSTAAGDATLLDGGCVQGDVASPGATTVPAPQAAAAAAAPQVGSGETEQKAAVNSTADGAAGHTQAATSCAGGPGVVPALCGRGTAACIQSGSGSSSSLYPGSCLLGAPCSSSSSSSAVPTPVSSSSCTPFSPLNLPTLAAAGDAGAFCLSDQTQAAVQQSYLQLQAGVWGHLPPPSRELESPSGGLSGSEDSPGKRRCSRAAAAGGAGSSAVGCVSGGSATAAGGGGSHLSRLSQNSMPAAGFITSRTSSSCTGVEAVLALPELPEVDFIERIGKGCFGEVYKGIWNDSVVAVKVISAKRTTHPGDHPEQLSMELARHEYESWINANLRHPNIMQLFTSFTVCLDGSSSNSGAAGGSVQQQPQPQQQQQQQRQEALGPAGATSSCAEVPVPAAGPAAGAHSRGGAGCHVEAAAPEGVVCLGVAVSGDAAAAAAPLPSSYKWHTHLVMEFCDMGTLQTAIQCGWFRASGGAPRLDAILATSKELAAAVAYLHSMDVVHGDLKGTNVLLKGAAVTRHDARGFVAKVADFGLSRVMDVMGEALPLEQQGFGALTHAAPELLSGQPLCAACDVFSVGVLLWELLVGQAAFAGVHPGEVLSLKLHHDSSDLLPFPLGTPPALVLLAHTCWAPDPAQRPPMTMVVSQLNSIALDLLGVEWCLGIFPDVARLVSSRRLQCNNSMTSSSGVGGGYASW